MRSDRQRPAIIARLCWRRTPRGRAPFQCEENAPSSRPRDRRPRPPSGCGPRSRGRGVRRTAGSGARASGRTRSSAAIASRPIRSSAPAPAWSPLLRCTVSRPVPSRWRSTSAHVSAAALERRSSASLITVTMATTMSPRRRAWSADSVRPPGLVRGRADPGERLCGQRCRLPRRLASPGLPAAESAQDPAHVRVDGGRGCATRGVLVGDGGDGSAQRRYPRARLGALGEVGGDVHGLRRERLDSLGRTPRRPGAPRGRVGAARVGAQDLRRQPPRCARRVRSAR